MARAVLYPQRQGRTWDSVPLPGVKPSDLSLTSLKRFRELAAASGRLSAADLSASDSGLLEKLKLVEGKYLKRAAVLLFHEDPDRFITGAFVKIGYFVSESDLAYHDEIHGSLFSTIACPRSRSLRGAQCLHGNGDIDHITHHPHVEKFSVSHAKCQPVKGKCRVKSGHLLFFVKR
jgi:hypothetical protein